MLKLNNKAVFNAVIILSNLNTSHVKVKQKEKNATFYFHNYLNTSHVKVKHMCRKKYGRRMSYLNTSHVKVKLLLRLVLPTH